MTERETSTKQIIVERTPILTTRTVVFSAWERTNFGSAGSDGHSNIMSAKGSIAGLGWLGRIGSRRLPEDIEALEGGTDERIEAVEAWHDSEYRRAYDAILRAFPELASNSTRRFDRGDIIVAEAKPDEGGATYIHVEVETGPGSDEESR